MLRAAMLLLSASAVYAQPVTFSVTGSFRDGKDIIAYPGGAVKLEFLAADAQQSTPSTTNFTFATYGKIRSTLLTSSPVPPAGVVYLDLLIKPAGSAETAQISAAIEVAVPQQLLRFNPVSPAFGGIQRVGSVAGVNYSFADVILPIPLPTGTIDLTARLTRGNTVIDPPVLSLTSVRGRTLAGEVRVNTVACAPFTGGLILDFSGTTGGAGCGPGGYFFSAFPLSGVFNFMMPFFASGVPRADLRITVDVQPDPDTLRAMPRELNFFYTRGAPEPPDQFITVSGSSDLVFDAAFYDNTWVTITRQGVANTSAGVLRVTPRMSTKPAGTHRTAVRIYTGTGVTDTVFINFFVADGPALLNTRVQPTLAGGIAYAPALNEYRNGDPLELTATANPGYVFSHWSGDLVSKQNPIQVTLNGTLNLTAVFTGPSPCTYTFSPSRVVALSTGDVVNTRVQTMSWCETRVASPPSWIFQQFPFNFFGDGNLGLQLGYNTGATRVHTLRIGNQGLVVEQLSPPCDSGVLLTAPGALDAAAGTVMTATTASAQCVYSAESTQSWLGVPSNLQYFGNSQIALRAMQNPLDQPRTASVLVAGRRLAILQKPAQPANVFSDVDPTSDAAPYIDLLARSNIDAGCTQGRFCPKQLVTRQEAAMLLVRAIVRSDDFRAPAGAHFQDVPATHPMYRYVQKMVELGLTSGCRYGYFCPNDTLDRGQLAILLSRARSYSRFPALLYSAPSGSYADVPFGLYTYPAQQMAVWGIDYGCDRNRFCPGDKVTREQMAVALVRMFLTP